MFITHAIAGHSRAFKIIRCVTKLCVYKLIGRFVIPINKSSLSTYTKCDWVTSLYFLVLKTKGHKLLNIPYIYEVFLYIVNWPLDLLLPSRNFYIHIIIYIYIYFALLSHGLFYSQSLQFYFSLSLSHFLLFSPIEDWFFNFITIPCWKLIIFLHTNLSCLPDAVQVFCYPL